MIKSLNHIGIAVRDLDAAIESFKKIFAFSDIHREIVPEQKVSIASFKVGDVLIELTSATDENSPIAKFIEKRGEGIHHLAFESNDIQSDLGNIKDAGITLINDKPSQGAHNMQIAFLHPKSTNGVLLEICQH